MPELNHSNVKKSIFPVGLLAAGRQCVVVGAGGVGMRKVRLLLDAGAEVRVVSPDAPAELCELCTRGVQHVERTFEPGDVDGAFLVFAATADRSVNQEILAACRERGVYACSVDKSWPQGDFVTPATVRKDGITVAVSTGGKSCRRAKMIRDSLNRHLEMVESADLLVVGTSHDVLPIHRREPFHLAGPRLEDVGAMLMQIWGVHEFSILNTCNRVELHAVAGEGSGVAAILQRVLGFAALDAGDFYVKRGYDAFAHLSLVAAGLRSQTPGEKHIVAQLKEAVGAAVERGWAGAMIQQWLDGALHVSKHIRNETRAMLRPCEIEDLCLAYLDRECPDWETRAVTVVGAGTVGTGVVNRLVERGRAVDWCYHRHKPDVNPAHADRVRVCTMDELHDRLVKTGVLICAAGGGQPVIRAETTALLDSEPSTVIVDLAVPRNVAPEVGERGHALRVVDLDDLKHWYRRKMADWARVFDLATAAVASHETMYDKLIDTFQGGNARQ